METLAGVHFCAAVVVALDHGVNAPLRVGWGAFAAAGEIHFVLDFELTDIFFDLG